MAAVLHFWFDYSCPYAYLASTQVETLAKKTAAELVWEPMLLGGVFAANDTPQNLMNILSPAKAAHNANDMMRWAEIFGVALHWPKAHPMRTVDALRATLATGIDPKVIHGFYKAYWIDGRPPSEKTTMQDVLSAAGHDLGILEKLGDYKDDLRKRTDRAIAKGIFGAPTYVIDDELFWGQDRMHFVEKALLGQPLRMT